MFAEKNNNKQTSTSNSRPFLMKIKPGTECVCHYKIAYQLLFSKLVPYSLLLNHHLRLKARIVPWSGALQELPHSIAQCSCSISFHIQYWNPIPNRPLHLSENLRMTLTWSKTTWSTSGSKNFFFLTPLQAEEHNQGHLHSHFGVSKSTSAFLGRKLLKT